MFRAGLHSGHPGKVVASPGQVTVEGAVLLDAEPLGDLPGFLEAEVANQRSLTVHLFEHPLEGLLDAAFVIDLKETGSPESPLDSPLLDAIEKIAKKMAGGAPVVPVMSTGATDSRFFREKGMVCYGLMPLPVSEEEEGTFHNHNERVRVSSVRFGLEFTWNVILEAAGP